MSVADERTLPLRGVFAAVNGVAGRVQQIEEVVALDECQDGRSILGVQS